jgi:hypothetical protein
MPCWLQPRSIILALQRRLPTIGSEQGDASHFVGKADVDHLPFGYLALGIYSRMTPHGAIQTDPRQGTSWGQTSMASIDRSVPNSHRLACLQIWLITPNSWSLNLVCVREIYKAGWRWFDRGWARVQSRWRGRHIEIVDGWILGKTREKDREILLQGRARQREGLALKTNSQVVVRARI